MHVYNIYIDYAVLSGIDNNTTLNSQHWVTLWSTVLKYIFWDCYGNGLCPVTDIYELYISMVTDDRNAYYLSGTTDNVGQW